LETNMHRPQNVAPGGARSVPPYAVNDLCAQIAPLNRYGPTGLATVIATALRALTDAARPAFCAALGCDRA
jgi:hypothetical protein